GYRLRRGAPGPARPGVQDVGDVAVVGAALETLRRALVQGQWPRRERAPDDMLLDRGGAILDTCGARAVSPDDPAYPRGLPDLEKLQRYDALRPDKRVRRSKKALRPIVFLRGSWISERTVAIVGARRATVDGVRVARELA